MHKPPVYDRAALALSETDRTKLREDRGGYWRFLLNQTRIEWTDGIRGRANTTITPELALKVGQRRECQ
mgnify:CR=1 FL=1